MPTANLKKTLRTQSRQQRMAMPMSEISRDIANQLRNWPAFKEAEAILAYWPLLWEVDLRELMRDYSTKRWYLPKIEDSVKADMHFYPYNPEIPLERGPHGLMEPSDADAPWDPTTPGKTLVLCPALMADTNGYRLGAGRGYYDRFFQSLPEPTSDQTLTRVSLVPALHYVSALPTDTWDKPVDGVITDAGCYMLSAANAGSPTY